MAAHVAVVPAVPIAAAGLVGVAKERGPGPE